MLVVSDIDAMDDRELRGTKSRTRWSGLKRSLATSKPKITPILSPMRISSIKKDGRFFAIEVGDSDGLQCATSDDKICVRRPHTSYLGTAFTPENSMLGLFVLAYDTTVVGPYHWTLSLDTIIGLLLLDR